MFRLLLWKEWKENLWKLCFCLLAGVMAIVLLYRMRVVPDIVNCWVITLVQMFVITVLYTMDTFAGEFSNGTAQFLVKLPIRLRWVFLCKYIVSAGSIIVIFLAIGCLSELFTLGREQAIGDIFRINLLACLTVLSVFTWHCLFGSRSRSEAVALVVLAAVLAGWAIIAGWALLFELQGVRAIAPYVFISDFFRADAYLVMYLQGPLLITAVLIGAYRYEIIGRYL